MSGLIKNIKRPIEQAVGELSTSLAEPNGSSLVGFIQPGTGAVLRTVQDKIRESLSVKDFGAIADGNSHPLSEIYASLAAAQVKYPFALSLSEETDRCALQAMVNAAPQNAVMLVGAGMLKMDDKPVLIDGKDYLTFVGGYFLWNGTSTNVFKFVNTVRKPEFVYCRFKGNNTPASTFGAIGCSSGAITHSLNIYRCTFDQVPFGVYINADTAGAHYNPTVSQCEFIDAPRYSADSASGSGLGLVFAEGGSGRIVNGLSIGNTFTRCGRHGLYISNGGNVKSIGDRFVEHRNDGAAIVTELAALQVSRDSKNVAIISPVFEACRDTALSITSVQTGGLQTFPENINVINPVFKGNYSRLIRIGNDTPSVNGFIRGLTIQDIEICSNGETPGNAIAFLSGLDVTIKGIKVREYSGASTISELVRLYGFGTASETNRVTISDVIGSMTGGSSSGVYVDTRVCMGTAVYTVDNVLAGANPINYQATVTNPSIQVNRINGLIVDSPRSTTDPNGVYAAPPGTLFVSRQGTQRSLWIKESLFGSSGWVPVKTRSVGKRSTANRPNLTSSEYDIGTQYLDTTLAAAGKPIWWSGVSWIDSTGTVV